MSLISYLTKVHFADGVLEEALPAEITRLGIKRPLIITDRDIAGAGLLDRAIDVLPRSATPHLFAAVDRRPTEATVRTAVTGYRLHKADGLIGLGGGSVIDVAKAVALAVSHDAPLVTYAEIEGGIARITDRLPPLIAIPTTAGTGSEVGRTAMIIIDGLGKLSFTSPYLVPKVAICDPTLTLGLAGDLTAGTGMDALSHCLESYLATAYNPPADGIAIDGLSRAAGNLERAVADGGNRTARREMMAAAMNGTLAAEKGLGAVHALASALGGLGSGLGGGLAGGVEDNRLHHGTVSAVLLPHVLEFNAPAVSDRFDAVRHAFGLSDHADLATEMSKLGARLGLPSTLSALGIDEGDLEEAAARAAADPVSRTNPRKARADDYLAMLRAAF